MWSYLKHSNIQVVLDLNPYQWRVYALYAGETVLDPHRRLLSVKLLFLRLNFILDDGSTM